jgi:hypothetical protein
MEFHIRGGDQVPYASLLKEMYKSQTVLPSEWNMAMARPVMPMGTYYDYGLGWFTGRYRGK